MYKNKPNKPKKKPQPNNNTSLNPFISNSNNSVHSKFKKPHQQNKQLNEVKTPQPVRMVMLSGNQVSKQMKRQLKDLEEAGNNENAKKQKKKDKNKKKEEVEVGEGGKGENSSNNDGGSTTTAVPSLTVKGKKDQGRKLLTKHLVKAPYEFTVPTLPSELEESILNKIISSLELGSVEENSKPKKKVVPGDLVVGLNSVMRMLQNFSPQAKNPTSLPPLKLVLTCTGGGESQNLIQPLHMLGAVLSSYTSMSIAIMSKEAGTRLAQSLKIPRVLVIGIKNDSEQFKGAYQLFEQADVKSSNSTWVQAISKQSPTFHPLKLKRVEIPAPPPKQKPTSQPAKPKKA